MPRKPVPTVTRIPLPHDWRDHVRDWQITAMLNKIPQSDYLAEVRAFELDALANEALSDDWAGQWRAWCRRRLVERFNTWAPAKPAEPVEAPTMGLFDAI